jgi:hypothetical protein
MKATIDVDPTILLFAFRYALNRNTAAPWAVSVDIKRHWENLDQEFQRQVKEDIERQIKLSEGETAWHNQVSEDWIRLLEWINER